MSSEPLLGAIRAIPLQGQAVWPLALPAVTLQHGARARQDGSAGIVSALGVGEGENGL